MVALSNGFVHEVLQHVRRWLVSVVERYVWLLDLICFMLNHVILIVLLSVIVYCSPQGAKSE